MRISAQRMTGFTLLVLAVVMAASVSVHRKVEGASRGTAAVAALLAPAPPADPRAYGWDQLGLVLSPDPGNRTSTSWILWSTKCNLADGIAPPTGADQQMNLISNCAGVRTSSVSEFFASAQPSLQTPNPIRIGSVYFNSAAANWVLQDHVNLPAPGASDPLAPAADGSRTIQPFPADSMIVKAVWEMVVPRKVSGQHVAQLHVFDPSVVKPDNQNQLEPIEQWPTINLNMDDKSCNFGTGAPAPITLGQTVAGGCFVTTTTSFAAGTSGLINHLGLRTCPSNCVFVLVGLHVAHKEGNQWTWTTFWWTNNTTAETPYFEGQSAFPGTMPAQYTHFAMDTNQANQGALYNPYQEGPQGPNSTLTTCAGCHSYADVVTSATGPGAFDFGLALADSVQQGPQTHCPNQEVCTDSIWSLATARDINNGMAPGAMVLTGKRSSSKNKVKLP